MFHFKAKINSRRYGHMIDVVKRNTTWKNEMDLFEAKQSHAGMLWLEKIHSYC